MFFLKSMTSVGEQIISITSMLAGASVSGILSRPSQGFVKMKDNDGDTVENRTGRVKRFSAISSCQLPSAEESRASVGRGERRNFY